MKKKYASLKLIIPLLLSVLFNNEAHSQTTFYDTYAFRIPLTLNNSSLGITTDQTNFVALLKVTNPVFVTGLCADKTSGTSAVPVFAIVDSAYSTTTELNYQIENYNTTTGVIYFWVKIPLLYHTGSSNGANQLYCYFGSTNPSVTHDAAWQKLVWSGVTATAGINYSGVWHFNESPSNPAPQFSDATVNDNNLSIGSTGTVTQNTASQIGNGITLSTTSVLDIGATNLPNTNADQSLSIWASYPAIPTTTANLIVLENSSNPATTGNGTQLGVLINGGATTLQTWRWANRTTPLVKTSTLPTANAWHHYVYTYKASTNQSILYVDGAVVGGPTTDTSNPPFSGATNMVSFGDYINNNIGGSGAHVVGGQSYTGTMDESHVIGATLAADWVKAEYVNQKNPDAFTTPGTMQTSPTRASAFAGYLVYTWKGVNTNIADPNNWDDSTTGTTNEAPVNANVNWVIPAGLSNYPVLTQNSGVYGLTIASGAYINLNGYNLGVGCNIYNSSGGQILYGGNNASKITWDGSLSAQYYYGSNAALTAQVGAMEVNNTAAGTINITGGPVDVFSSLTMTNGNLAIGAAPAALTLKSTSNLTASVTQIPATSTITGNVNVERYISGGSNTYRGYRFLSSPVYTAQSGSNYYYDFSYITKYAPTTGTTGTAGGFNQTGNPTIYLYRDNVLFTNSTFNTGNFRGVNKINNSPLYNVGVDYDGNFNMTVGTGFFFFYRGNLNNLSSKFTSTASADTNVFVSTGTLNQQAVTVVNWYTGLPQLQYDVVPGNAAGYAGFNLVGNPYASSIDWNTYSTTNTAAGIYAPGVGKTIYIYNETSKMYATYSNSIGLNGGSNIIPSGQGFFVQTTGAAGITPQLIFNESAKTNSQLKGPTQSTGNSTLLLSASPVAGSSIEYLRLQLAADSVNTDETAVRFDTNASNGFVTNEDSQYLPGGGTVSLSSMSADIVTLAINDIPLPKPKQTIKLNVGITADGQYTFNRTGLQNIPALFDVWLMDAYKKDSLDLKNNTTYKFNATLSDTNSYGANRFTLVIRQNPALGVHLLNFTATKATGGALTVWKTENEANYTNFTIERSTNGGVTFEALGGFASDSLGTYNFLDKAPVNGADQYRLKITDLNGAIGYSQVVTLIYGNAANLANTVNIYPNPAKSDLNLNIIIPGTSTNSPVLQSTGTTTATVPNTVYGISIVDISGSIIKTATTTQTNWQTDVTSLEPGTYIIQVINAGNKSIIGKGTFIKL